MLMVMQTTIITVLVVRVTRAREVTPSIAIQSPHRRRDLLAIRSELLTQCLAKR